jgi:hypothetical protein
MQWIMDERNIRLTMGLEWSNSHRLEAKHFYILNIMQNTQKIGPSNNISSIQMGY